MQTDSSTGLKRAEIRKIFKSRHGSQTEAARELEVAPVTISLWLRGRVQSKRLDEAIPAFAQKLLAEEQQRKAS